MLANSLYENNKKTDEEKTQILYVWEYGLAHYSKAQKTDSESYAYLAYAATHKHMKIY